jgi:hypothetical protein
MREGGKRGINLAAVVSLQKLNPQPHRACRRLYVFQISSSDLRIGRIDEDC